MDRTISSNNLPQYGNVAAVADGIAELYLPPRRMTPSEAAAQYLRNEKGAFDLSVSPMMAEPLDMMASRAYQGVVFIGPARASKTFAMILGSVAYIATCSPGDTLIVQMSKDAAGYFSKSDIDRSIRESPELKSRISPRFRDDTTYTKMWRSGMILQIGWPAISQLSSKTLQTVMMTDYDRPECRDNVDGEGPMWDIAFKRVETYMSRGKCMLETSPGEAQTDANWRATSPHEAPPVRGALSIYNRGTRARFYWPCLSCGEFSQAAPGLLPFDLPALDELQKLVVEVDPAELASRYARVTCKHCGAIHEMENKPEMSARGMWLHEGERIENGKRVGTRRQTSIVSYWLGGVAASYQRWDALLEKYFQNLLTYVKTGDESGIKATTLTDQAYPFMPERIRKSRGPDRLLDRIASWPRGTIPDGVRFLTAAVDVQANSFVVQVEGWGVAGRNWVIDRFVISTGKRMETDARLAALDPASYLEDWDMLLSEVVDKKYPLASDPEHLIGAALTVCDSGGRDGVTYRAYEFWRKLRTSDFVTRFRLIKGDPRIKLPPFQETWPDARNTGNDKRASFVKGDVPVYLLNVNLIKDGLDNDLGREVDGPGYCVFPDWLPRSFFDELTAETRSDSGIWVKETNARRNETLDLKTYNRGAFLMLRADQINWDMPPAWATDPATRSKMEGGGTQIDRAAMLAKLARGLNGNA